MPARLNFLLLGILSLLFSGLHGQDRGADFPRISSLLERLPHDTLLVDSLNKISKSLRGTNMPLSAEYAKAGLSLADSIGYLKGHYANAYFLAGIYKDLGLFTRSFEYIDEAERICRQMGDSTKLGWIYNYKGILYRENRLYEKAETNFLTAHEIFKQNGDTAIFFFPLINLGSSYNDAGSPDKAVRLYENVLTLYYDSTNTMGNASLYNNLGNSLYDLHRNDSALLMLHRALVLKKAQGNSTNLPNTLTNIAKVQVRLGNYDSTEVYLKASKEEALRLQNEEFLLEILEVTAWLEAAENNFQDAYALLLKYSEKRDSVIAAGHQEKLQELVGFLDLDEKNSQVELLQKDNEIIRSNQRFQFVAFCGLLLVLFLVLGMYLNNRKFNSKLQSAYTDLSLTNAEISRQQEEILRQKSDLERQNQRLEDLVREKDGLIGIVAHDLKSPLNKTLAIVSLLEGNENFSEAGLRQLEMIKSTGSEAIELIKSLLILSETEAGDAKGTPKPSSELHLESFLKDRVDSFAAAASQKDINIIADFDGANGVMVRSVPQDLERIMDNFISNAIKFSPKGKDIEVGIKNRAKQLSLYVKDSGPGISLEDQKKLFKKFQKLTARPTGGESSHGLGLAIVKSLAEQLQGEVAVQSAPGAGATFEFVFPSSALS